jgi:hypothetical protein
MIRGKQTPGRKGGCTAIGLRDAPRRTAPTPRIQSLKPTGQHCNPPVLPAPSGRHGGAGEAANRFVSVNGAARPTHAQPNGRMTGGAERVVGGDMSRRGSFIEGSRSRGWKNAFVAESREGHPATEAALFGGRRPETRWAGDECVGDADGGRSIGGRIDDVGVIVLRCCNGIFCSQPLEEDHEDGRRWSCWKWVTD